MLCNQLLPLKESCLGEGDPVAQEHYSLESWLVNFSFVEISLVNTEIEKKKMLIFFTYLLFCCF